MFRKFHIGLLAALLFAAACSSTPAEGTPVQENTAIAIEGFPTETPSPGTTTQATVTEEAAQPTTSSGSQTDPSPALCANPFYPVREGAQWNYQGTSSITSNYIFTDTITAVRDDGFTLTTTFADGVTRKQEWACTPEGLVALQMGGGLSATGMNLTVETQNASGVTYPSKINAGDTWQYALTFTGTMDIAGRSGVASGSTQSNFTALGTESVSVPAGTFNAMKVQMVTTFTATVDFQGLSVPITFTNTTFSWYAEGTGWVKSETTGDISGQGYSEKIQLQWYNLPPG
jgi:hypothetical protein